MSVVQPSAPPERCRCGTIWQPAGFSIGRLCPACEDKKKSAELPPSTPPHHLKDSPHGKS